MENVFDSLCSALAEPEVKKAFLDSEGVDLMLIMMKSVICQAYIGAHYSLSDFAGRKCSRGQDQSRSLTMRCRVRLERCHVRHSLRLSV